MKHSSIDQLRFLIDSLGDSSLNANGRIEILQKIRQTAAGPHVDDSNKPIVHGDQIDAMVLEAIEIALLPFERESPEHAHADPFPAAEYIQP